MGLLHHPFSLYLDLELLGHQFSILNYFLWLRITDKGSVPEMRIWSILLIESDLKWCIHLSRSLFSYSSFRPEITIILRLLAFSLFRLLPRNNEKTKFIVISCRGKKNEKTQLWVFLSFRYFDFAPK